MRFLHGEASTEDACRFARYLRHRMSYELMCEVAVRAKSILGWEPGPLFEFIHAPIDDKPPAEQRKIWRARKERWERDLAGDWPARMAAWEKELEREIEERFFTLSERHGWERSQMAALAQRVGTTADENFARMREDLDREGDQF